MGSLKFHTNAYRILFVIGQKLSSVTTCTKFTGLMQNWYNSIANTLELGLFALSKHNIIKTHNKL